MVLVLAVAGLAWSKRIDLMLMLMLVKFKSEGEYVVAPNRDIPWEQGPLQAVAVDKSLAERFEPGDEYIYWPN